MTNHPHANRPSHRSPQDHFQPQYSEERPSHFPQPPLDHPPYHRSRSRSRRRDHPFPNAGYGGGATARPRSPRHDRYWPDQGPPRSYRSDPYQNQTRNPIDPPPRPKYSNNAYTGGDPFNNQNRLPRRERPVQPHDTLAAPQNSPPLHPKPRHNSPKHHRDPARVSGPIKPVFSSKSPVKPEVRPRLKPAASPFNAAKSPIFSAASSPTNTSRAIATLDKPNSSNRPNPSANPLSEHPQNDRRFNRTLSCEKRREDTNLANRDAPQCNAVSEAYAIAHPHAAPLETVRDIPRRIEQGQPNGSYLAGNHSSNQTETGDRSRSHEQVENIFRPPKVPSRASRASRVPKIPDEEMWKPYIVNKADTFQSNGTQLKGEVARKERLPLKIDPPRLRSVPVESRSYTSEDTPQGRAAAAAMERARRGDHTDAKLGNDCNGPNGSLSPNYRAPDDPYDSVAQSRINPSENSGRETSPNLTTSIAKMNIVDGKRNCSLSEREQSQKLVKNEDSRHEHPNQQRQSGFARGGNRGTRLVKRRSTNFDGSRETRTKRPRTSAPPETVNVDDTTALRRSKRHPPFVHKNKKWETIRFEEDRVCALFLSQLQNQPMLLRISFLGMADGDLRTTLDIWKGGTDLPEPQERRLEINNNRIRNVSNDICARICALRVISLNLSCNLLTTIGGKIGSCSRLRFLDLSRNRLSSLPQELCDLTILEVLNLSHNEISRLPSGLCRLKHLEVLSLAWNKLEVLPEDVTTEGAVLTDLDLSHNEEFHFFPRCAEHWTKLEVLHIVSTKIHSSFRRRELRLRPAALVKELAGRKQDMFNNKRPGLRSESI